MITDKDKFAAALVGWRMKQGLTVWQASKLSGLRYELIKRLERGEGSVESLIAYEEWIRCYDNRQYWVTAPRTKR